MEIEKEQKIIEFLLNPVSRLKREGIDQGWRLVFPSPVIDLVIEYIQEILSCDQNEARKHLGELIDRHDLKFHLNPHDWDGSAPAAAPEFDPPRPTEDPPL